MTPQELNELFLKICGDKQGNCWECHKPFLLKEMAEDWDAKRVRYNRFICNKCWNVHK